MNTPHDRFTGHDGGSGDRAQEYGAADASGADRDVAEQLKSEGKEQLDQYRDVAADKLDTLADSVKAAASQLDGGDVGYLSGHIAGMADSMSQLSDGLRNKSVDQILHDVRQVARDNPTLFLAGSIALGFGLTRFARASTPADDTRGSERQPAAGQSSTSGFHHGDASHPQGQRHATDARGRHDAASNIAGTVEHPVTGAGSDTSSEARTADTRGGLAGNTPSGSGTGALAGSGSNSINDASLGTAAGSGPRDAGGGSAAALGTRTGSSGSGSASSSTYETGSTYGTGPDQSNGRKPS